MCKSLLLDGICRFNLLKLIIVLAKSSLKCERFCP